MFQVMMEREDFHSFDVSSLRTGIIGGTGYSPSIFSQIEEAFNFRLLPGLGQTEMMAGIATGSLSDPLELRSTTVGRFERKVEGKIVSLETGMPLPPRHIGEICGRGPLLMCGYYKRPELTEQAIDSEGWLHTGDLGWEDEDGYIHLSGRLKDIINRGGEKILPQEVEEAIMARVSGVHRCAVFGVPDPYYGEQACAAIVASGHQNLDAEGIRTRLEASIAAYKVPRYFLFLEELPETATGKVHRRQLRETALSTLRLDTTLAKETRG